MAPLAAGTIQHACAGGQLEELEQTRDLAPVLLRPEDRLVLEEILRVEIRAPPLGGGAAVPARRPQKKTGSRYAPNTSSIAARISYSVQ